MIAGVLCVDPVADRLSATFRDFNGRFLMQVIGCVAHRWVAGFFVCLCVVAGAAHAQPIDRASDAEVDRLLALAGGGNAERLRDEFGRLGASATPRLAEHVLGNNANRRLMAMVCLQYCWSEVARDALVQIIPRADTQTRQLALQILGRQESGEDLADALAPLTESRDHRVAGPAIQYALRAWPDRGLMLRALSDRRLAEYAYESLTRYYGQDLGEPTRTLARRAQLDHRALLITALIHQHDDSAETRRVVADLLVQGPSLIRDRAAEYLRWHGTPDELAVLENAAERERDVYANASIRGAIDAIHRRAERFVEPGEVREVTYPDDPAQAYRQAYETLGSAYTQANRAAAIALLASAEPYEPYWRFGLTEHTAELEARITERLVLQVLASGYTIRGVSIIGGRGVAREDVPEIPTDLTAATLIPPVRDFFDPTRESFGVYTGDNVGPFSQSHHVGDDVAWGLEHETIVAIGDGLVRRVVIGQQSWGGLVVIEHRDADGNAFCSLYAHMGPLVAVREGDQVMQGQKIGALGRTYTWEGGGYRAHLHFGIHEGPYDQEQRWVTGYISRADFQGDHGWVDPQVFIRERRE